MLNYFKKENTMSKKWDFIRETKEKAIKAGIDKDTGLHRTGLDEYLNAIFPDITDWVHDKSIGVLNGEKCQCRPDYRSEPLKLIVEFDGLQHYTNPNNIIKDVSQTLKYEVGGYKVVRIPYFIQLTKSAIKILFDIIVDEDFFDPSIPSIGIKGENTPAFLCPIGIERMAKEFVRFPDQYKVNLEALEKEANERLTGVNLLKEHYAKYTKQD